MKVLMTGNEAVARGVWEAGAEFAASYPGTPSTEILETLATYDKSEIIAEWAPNEKVALESAFGASMAGVRSFASMKCVGVNASADPWMCFSYTGVGEGMVVAIADEPGQQSSGQSAQDDRTFLKHARHPFFAPANSQEAKDMVKEAYKISNQIDALVAIHMTTRICHAKTIVELGEREAVEHKPYVKDASKYVPLPANSPKMVKHSFEKLESLKEYSEKTAFNFEDLHSPEIGVVCSGCSYYFAKEVFGNSASYYKVGFVNPLPINSIKAFASKVKKLYVIEETDPLIENELRLNGIECIGKDLLPITGELLPEVLREKLLGIKPEKKDVDRTKIIGRPPSLCAGCPHRGVFYELSKIRNVMVSSDIGCYSLGSTPPYNVGDTGVCMGSSISIGHGFQKAMSKINGTHKVVSILGDSTFIHTGIQSLISAVYNNSATVNIILDNRITGMTGHQENPTSGFTAQGDPAPEVDIPAVCAAIGVKHITTVNPNNLEEFRTVLKEYLEYEEPSVIITRWPCALKKFSRQDKMEFPEMFQDRYHVNDELCIGCKSCLKCGCPAIIFDKDKKKAVISENCVGCGVCSQICNFKAIEKEFR
ncbi:MAG: thiamine pyrophosphate-dependent enzyme [Lachnospiraceae bacterium]|jgi:indolepyruvate ferredoxin oxidoreductase alpha subunit